MQISIRRFGKMATESILTRLASDFKVNSITGTADNVSLNFPYATGRAHGFSSDTT